MPSRREEPVRANTADKVLTLTLNAPPAHALSMAMIARLQSHLDAAATDKGINVIVLAATGHLFCAGHDLLEMLAHRDDADRGRAWFTDLFTRCSTLMTSITRHPKPVIAQVDGLATAAGCQLVASADLAFASERATFCTPGVAMGGFCTTPLVALSRAVGRKRAMDMALSADRIDATTAADWGLVNRVLPHGELAGHVRAYATRLAARSPGAIASGKRAFHTQLDMDLDAAYEHATRVMVEHFLTGDGKEGMQAFADKRPAIWRDD